MRPRRLIDALRWRLRATRRIWRPGATHAMPLLEPEQVPDGRIDHPPAGKALERGLTTVSGWATFPGRPCARVEIWLGEERLGLARLGVPRADLGHQLGPAAALSGFELIADLTEVDAPSGEVALRAVAFDDGGSSFEISVPVRLRPALAEVDEAPAEPPLAPSRAGPGALKTLVFTHQLTLGGAQLYLLDLLGELLDRGSVEPTVVSTMDGPLRERLADLGIPSHLTSFELSEGPLAHSGRVEELAAWAGGRGFEAVFVNTATATAFPGVEVAGRLGVPAVWAIHESFPPPLLWGGLHRRVRRAAERSLEDAAAVVFEAEATRRLFEPHAPGGRFLTIPYGLDLEPIDAARKRFDPRRARLEAGVPQDAELVVCIGTVEPRKAQVPLTFAFESIAAGRPRARLAIVGARDDEDARLLGEYLSESPLRERIDLVPVTPDVEQWYGMADVLVCASDLESLPRTVLEAMAWETPVLATDVFGLPELIDDGETGWLCPPRDVTALAAALERALDSSAEERRRMGAAGRALVERRHSLPEYGRRIAELLEEARERGARAPSDSDVVGG